MTGCFSKTEFYEYLLKVEISIILKEMALRLTIK